MILLEQASERVSSRALSLFTAKVQRALRLSGDVDVRVTSSRELRKLNRAFLHKDKPTDVLSFPAQTPLLGGDIAISIQIATANAKQFGHPISTELKVLILHGLLHLAGYDHENDGGEMQAREAKLRLQFGLPTTLIERAQIAPLAGRGISVRRSARSANVTSAAPPSQSARSSAKANGSLKRRLVSSNPARGKKG